MSYRVWVYPEALAQARATPGNVRSQIKQALPLLQNDPRPSGSKGLDWPELGFEPRRLRIGAWRVICTVHDSEQLVQFLAVRKRPPYDYGDLAELLAQLN